MMLPNKSLEEKTQEAAFKERETITVDAIVEIGLV